MSQTSRSDAGKKKKDIFDQLYSDGARKQSTANALEAQGGYEAQQPRRTTSALPPKSALLKETASSQKKKATGNEAVETTPQRNVRRPQGDNGKVLPGITLFETTKHLEELAQPRTVAGENSKDPAKPNYGKVINFTEEMEREKKRRLARNGKNPPARIVYRKSKPNQDGSPASAAGAAAPSASGATCAQTEARLQVLRMGNGRVSSLDAPLAVRTTRWKPHETADVEEDGSGASTPLTLSARAKREWERTKKEEAEKRATPKSPSQVYPVQGRRIGSRANQNGNSSKQ